MEEEGEAVHALQERREHDGGRRVLGARAESGVSVRLHGRAIAQDGQGPSGGLEERKIRVHEQDGPSRPPRHPGPLESREQPVRGRRPRKEIRRGQPRRARLQRPERAHDAGHGAAGSAASQDRHEVDGAHPLEEEVDGDRVEAPLAGHVQRFLGVHGVDGLEALASEGPSEARPRRGVSGDDEDASRPGGSRALDPVRIAEREWRARQDREEHAASAQRALDADPSSLLLDDSLRRGKADPARRGVFARVAGLLVVDAIEILGGDADARVLDFHPELGCALREEAQRDAPARPAMPDRVRDEVVEDLAQPVAIGDDVRERRVDVDVHANPALGRRVAQHLAGLQGEA